MSVSIPDAEGPIGIEPGVAQEATNLYLFESH